MSIWYGENDGTPAVVGVWGIEQRMQFGTKPYLGLQTGYIILEKTDIEHIQLSLLAIDNICKLGYRI